MDGYGAMVRVSGGRVRVLAWDGPAPSASAAEPPVIDDDQAGVGTDLPVGVPFVQRWERLCDQLAIVTCYLRVPGSWR